MNLFLTGGGDQENFYQLDKLYLQSLDDDATIGVILHATDDPDDAFEGIESHYSKGNISFEQIENADDSLLEYDSLFIEGGNTFDLIKAMRESAFFELIKQFAGSGKPIYADSAGCIILGSDVHTAFLGEDGDEDNLKLQDYRGLDVVTPWAFHAHATPDEFDDLNDLLYDKGFPILALTEETGIHIQDDEIRVYGKEALTVVSFAGKKLLEPGESSTLTKLQE